MLPKRQVDRGTNHWQVTERSRLTWITDTNNSAEIWRGYKLSQTRCSFDVRWLGYIVHLSASCHFYRQIYRCTRLQDLRGKALIQYEAVGITMCHDIHLFLGTEIRLYCSVLIQCLCVCDRTRGWTRRGSPKMTGNFGKVAKGGVIAIGISMTRNR
jgi:hypothetical protein